MRVILFILFMLGGSALSAETSPTAMAPVSQFRLPTFTKEGHRSMMLLGSEAIVGAVHVQLVDLNLTLFSGDERNAVDTVILSPLASVNPEEGTVKGAAAVRIIRDDLEITGRGWTYDHRQKKVSIHSQARVVFRAQLPDILK